MAAGLVAFVVSTAFGANVVAIKTSMKGFGVFTNVGVRFSISIVAILVWALLTGKRISVGRAKLAKLAVIAVCFAAQISLFNYGLSLTLASRATLIVNLQPFIVLILAHFLLQEERIDLKRLAGTALGFLGVAYLFLGNAESGLNWGLGDLAVLGCTLFWAFNIVYIKKISLDFEPFELALYPLILALPVFYAEGMVFDSPMMKYLDGEIMLALGYQGLVTGALGFVVWNTLIRRYGAVSLNFFVFVVPITGVVSSVLILDEPFSRNIFVSLILVVAGVFLINRQPKEMKIIRSG